MSKIQNNTIYAHFDNSLLNIPQVVIFGAVHFCTCMCVWCWRVLLVLFFFSIPRLDLLIQLIQSHLIFTTNTTNNNRNTYQPTTKKKSSKQEKLAKETNIWQIKSAINSWRHESIVLVILRTWQAWSNERLSSIEIDNNSIVFRGQVLFPSVPFPSFTLSFFRSFDFFSL